MQNVQFFLTQPVSYFQEHVLSRAIDKKIVIIACAALCFLGMALLAMRHGFLPLFKKKIPPSPPVKPNISQKKLDIPQEEQKISSPKEVKKIEVPSEQTERVDSKKEEAQLPKADKYSVLFDSLGAENLIKSLSKEELKALILDWQKDDKMIAKLSKLFKEGLFPSNENKASSLTDWFLMLIEAVENSDLDKLMTQGEKELKLLCVAPSIAKILKSNSSRISKEVQLDEMLINYHEIQSLVFDYSLQLKASPAELKTFTDRKLTFECSFCYQVAVLCPSSEIGTLLKACSKYAHSYGMRQLLGQALLSHALLSKDLSRIHNVMSAYWTCWKIFDLAASANRCKKSLLENISSEEVLRAVYTAIPGEAKDKEEIKKFLHDGIGSSQIDLSTEIINKVLNDNPT